MNLHSADLKAIHHFGEIGCRRKAPRVLMFHVFAFVHLAPVAAAVARLRLISQNTIQFNFTGDKI